MLNSALRVYVISNGCPENRIDSARITEFFRQNGWTVKDNLQEADLVVFNACGLTGEAEDHSIRIIHYIETHKKPSAELMVCGCLPKINNSRLREVYQGNTFGSDDWERLDELFPSDRKAKDLEANFLIPRFQLDRKEVACSVRNGKRRPIIGLARWLKRHSLDSIQQRLATAVNVYGPNSYPIKISTGCLNACSFCAVKLSRGHVRSKPIDSIAREFDEGLEKNYREFALIGSDLGSFGRDKGTDLACLLRELLKREGDYKIRVRNIQPRDLIKMMPELIKILETGKISYLSSAAESGNDRILRLMNRGYRIDPYKEAIRLLNKEFPGIQLSTQLMVGFPTETEDEFHDTCRLLDELRFDYVEVYIFQPRPGTRAAEMEGQIDPRISEKRCYKLLIKSMFKDIPRKRRALAEYKRRCEARPG
jgi:tRNA A37 methylthiotransferase MiaB